MLKYVGYGSAHFNRMACSPGEEEVYANAPRLDFLWKDKETIYRDPVKIADFDLRDPNDPKIVFFDEDFEEVLKPSKDNGRRIMFVDAIGLFQTGKTTTHKALTRNVAHKAGNAIKEETHGVHIDGPYEINDLIVGYGLKPTYDFKGKAPHIYFLDIEGFGGFKNANNSEIALKLYQKMTIPFIGLSAVHLLMVCEKEGLSTFENIFSTIQLSDLASNMEFANGCNMIFCVTRCQSRPLGVQFSGEITKEISDKLSDKFIKYYLKNAQLDRYGITFRLRCLPNIDPLFPEPEKIKCFQQAFDIFAQEVYDLIEASARSGHVRYFENTIGHYRTLKTSINTPAFKIDAARSFNTQMQQTIERQIQEAIDESIQFVEKRLAEIKDQIKQENKFDQKRWNRNVNDILNKSLSIFDQALMPGILMRPETVARKETLQVRISKRLQQEGMEILMNMSPASMQRADQVVQREYLAIKDEIREKLNKLEYFLNHVSKKSDLINDIADVLRNIMTDTIKENMDINPDIVTMIEQRMNTLSGLIEADLNLLFGEAETRFTRHKTKVDVDPDPIDKTYMIVTVKEFIIDPFGNEIEGNIDVQRFPVNLVYDTRSWIQKIKDWFKGKRN